MDAAKHQSEGGAAASPSYRQPRGTGGKSGSSSTPASSRGDSGSAELSVVPTIGIAATSAIVVVSVVLGIQWAVGPVPQRAQLSEQAVTSEIAGSVVAQLEHSIKSALDAKLDTHLATIERKLGAVGASLVDLGKRVDGQEALLGGNQNRTDALASEVQRLTERISQLERGSGSEIQRLSARLTQLELNVHNGGVATSSPGPGQGAGNDATMSAVNWASKTLGASVDYAGTTQGIGRSRGNLLLSWFADQTGGRWSDSIRVSWPPEVLLEADLATPGRCFCFDGSSGHVTLHLPHEILVYGVSLEHPMVAVEVEPGSVPYVVAISDTSSFSKQVEFPRDGGHVWIEPPSPRAMQKIHLKVESNWGGMFTCLYGVRVFGKRQVNSSR